MKSGKVSFCPDWGRAKMRDSSADLSVVDGVDATVRLVPSDEVQHSGGYYTRDLIDW